MTTKKIKVLKLYKEGISIKDISKIFSVTYSRIWAVVNNYRGTPKDRKCFLCNDTFYVFSSQKKVNNNSLCPKCCENNAPFLFRSNGSRLQGMDFCREIARIRDNHTCQKKHGGCGSKWKLGQRRFDIHHLMGICGKKSRSYDTNISKLTTLCHKCHLNLKEVKKKMSKNSSPRPTKQKNYQRKWAKINKPWLSR